MVGRIILVAALVVSAACDGVDCRAGATRCTGDTVEVCDANGHWEHLADCSGVTDSTEPSWECCALEGFGDAGVLHACLPASECAEVSR